VTRQNFNGYQDIFILGFGGKDMHLLDPQVIFVREASHIAL